MENRINQAELTKKTKENNFHDIYGDEQLLSTSNTFKNQQMMMSSLKIQHMQSIFSEDKTGSSEDSVRLNFNWICKNHCCLFFWGDRRKLYTESLASDS